MPIAVANAEGRSFSWPQKTAHRSGIGIRRAGKSSGVGVRRFHSGESPKGYYSNVGVQVLAAWVRRFVPGNRLNASSARRSGFGIGRAGE